MAGGGSSELQDVRDALVRVELRLSQAEFDVGTLRNQVVGLERQVAGLQGALRGGDVAPAAGVRSAARVVADGGSVGPAVAPARLVVLATPAEHRAIVGKRGK